MHMKINDSLHSTKEWFLSISSFSERKIRLKYRWFLLFATLAILFPAVLTGLLFLCKCLIPLFPSYPIRYAPVSLFFLFACLFSVFVLHKINFFQRVAARNLVFIMIFLFGVGIYSSMPECIANIKKSNKSVPKEYCMSEKLIREACLSIHNGNIAIAAFFPSRGSYDIAENGTASEGNSKDLPTSMLLFYVLFHACVYIFAGYFFMSFWGFRTINRIQFFLTKDNEKYVFWCRTPEPQMFKLAKNILHDEKQPSQPVFSVEESNVSDAQALFQEMNFHDICLKLRKPGQIHQYCLHAAKHFLLSDDTDWNMDMAKAIIAAREKNNVHTFTRLYIRVTENSREIFFNRWADANNDPGEVEIILIDECEMIAEKFIHDYPMLDTIQNKIDIKTATVPEAEIKVLIIGFGRIGRAVLKHILCDCQYIRSTSPCSNNIPQKEGIHPCEASEYSQQGERVPFSADIIDCDAIQWDIFHNDHREACNRFNLKFMPINVLSDEFFQLQWKNLKNYNRIVLALGNADLNIEVAAVIEKLIRKNIILPSNGEIPEISPKKQLTDMREKLFLISPEVTRHQSSFQREESATQNSCLHQQNLFTLIGADYEIYSQEHIIDEQLSFMARLIDLEYNTHREKYKPMEYAQFERLAKQRNLPILPPDLTFKMFCSLPLTERKKIADSWCVKYEDCKLKTATMTDRKSSRASAANLKNYLKLCGLNEYDFYDKYDAVIADEQLKNNLGRTEHLRWIAYSLLEGFVLWEKPVATFGKANQTKHYLRHAALVEWDELPELNGIFGKDFQKIDLEIIENLKSIYGEYQAQNKCMKNTSAAATPTDSNH